MSDGDLVSRVRAGQAAAYEELARRWSARVLAVCRAKVGRGGAAEDLAQETLLRGFRSIHSLDHPDKFGAWLYGIALRTCKDWLKAQERSQVTFSDLGAERDPDAILCSQLPNHQPQHDRDDECQRLAAQVDSLPEDLRVVLMLFYYQELKYRDIAQMLGISVATVNARLTRARAMLRERLSRCER